MTAAKTIQFRNGDRKASNINYVDYKVTTDASPLSADRRRLTMQYKSLTSMGVDPLPKLRKDLEEAENGRRE